MRFKPRFRRGQTDSEPADYAFVGGFPTRDTVKRAYEDADFNRALQAYRFFYPTVSGLALYKGNQAIGLIPNQVFGVLDTQPRHLILTPSSDTVYGPMLLDLRIGPMIVELPPGALMIVAMDIYQRSVADMGLTGPDGGDGGEHLLLPPRFIGDVPMRYHVWASASNRVILNARSIPVSGDVRGAIDRVRTIRVRPLITKLSWAEPTWINITDRPQDTTPNKWEGNISFWQALHEVIDSEPPVEEYLNYYGELAALGIAKGSRFAPDARMRAILEEAARVGNAQMRVQAFADRRPERVVWPDRQWEWVGLRTENADFATPTYVDLDARETWFYQAIGASPAAFRRARGAAPLYWVCLHDEDGNYLDGAKTYRLTVPQPVPATLFWSLTVYDAFTRSEIQTDQRKAALRSQFELRDARDAELELYFGPKAPEGAEQRWIKTIPGRGWFAYFRLFGPAQEALDRSWKPGDLVAVRRDDSAFLVI